MSDLAAFREEKDGFMRGKASPLERAERRRFTGLSYFPEGEVYRARATFEPFSEREVVELTTSLGDAQPYLRWGRARFRLSGRDCALTLYARAGDSEPDTFFIPFKDATSGSETYGAGRYLEAKIEAKAQGNRLLLDFNYAYNPFCAYSPRYRCPLPPAENTLPLPILAGEKAYEGG